MLPVWLVISALFVGRSCGHFQEENWTKIPCGIDKICVPAHSCRERESTVNNEPFLDKRSEFDVCGPASKCCHINDQDITTQELGLDLPYLGSFPPKSFGVGKSLRLQALILKKLPNYYMTEIFFVRLQSGQDFWPKPEIAFELSDRHAIYTLDGNSKSKEFNQNIPRGRIFHLDIVREVSSYKVYVNKQLVVEIPRQADAKVMDTLYVNGDIQLWEVVIDNFSPTIAPKKALYVFHDTGVVKEGVSFIITGYILPECDEFTINLKAEKDVTLHVNARFYEGTIVFNTFIDMNWSDPGQVDYRIPTSLREASVFTCQILVTEKSYMIAMNGRHVHEFEHRLPYTSVSHIETKGGIDHVDFERTEVSQYPLRLRETGVEDIFVVAI